MKKQRLPHGRDTESAAHQPHDDGQSIHIARVQVESHPVIPAGLKYCDAFALLWQLGQHSLDFACRGAVKILPTGVRLMIDETTHIRIDLSWLDVYTVQLIRNEPYGLQVLQRLDYIYNDQLSEVVKQMCVGLAV